MCKWQRVAAVSLCQRDPCSKRDADSKHMACQECYLAYVLTELAGSTVMIFTRTCEATRKIALTLRVLGFSTVPIHGQMSQPKRLGALNMFKVLAPKHAQVEAPPALAARRWQCWTHHCADEAALFRNAAQRGS